MFANVTPSQFEELSELAQSIEADPMLAATGRQKMRSTLAYATSVNGGDFDETRALAGEATELRVIIR